MRGRGHKQVSKCYVLSKRTGRIVLQPTLRLHKREVLEIVYSSSGGEAEKLNCCSYRCSRVEPASSRVGRPTLAESCICSLGCSPADILRLVTSCEVVDCNIVSIIYQHYITRKNMLGNEGHYPYQASNPQKTSTIKSHMLGPTFSCSGCLLEELLS